LQSFNVNYVLNGSLHFRLNLNSNVNSIIIHYKHAVSLRM